ncbi:hypothetical protein H312_01306 [Anncaliia algerae PRA339]|uniref:Uncharacterized protein n=1 Tax=Anncaliia algerae PRA339 TaxID=1288291 RepID=A0A059F279_9MICR|nr:hypothetical protein H312_01306 [Anncaliia algerae PRA339]
MNQLIEVNFENNQPEGKIRRIFKYLKSKIVITIDFYKIIEIFVILHSIYRFCSTGNMIHLHIILIATHNLLPYHVNLMKFVNWTTNNNAHYFILLLEISAFLYFLRNNFQFLSVLYKLISITYDKNTIYEICTNIKLKFVLNILNTLIIRNKGRIIANIHERNRALYNIFRFKIALDYMFLIFHRDLVFFYHIILFYEDKETYTLTNFVVSDIFTNIQDKCNFLSFKLIIYMVLEQTFLHAYFTDILQNLKLNPLLINNS